MEMIELLDYAFFIAITIFFILSVLVILVKLIIPKKHNEEQHNNVYNHYAILIPARNESKVIEGLLKSIKEQTYNVLMEDVYVIIEDINDPTTKICEQYGAKVFVRVDLTKRRKGYALDEAVQDILNRGLKYDAYFIFDADNILDKNYFYEMNQTFNDGYDAALGYRNSKNLNDNVVASCSSLTFSMINSFGNRRKVNDNINATISGTGFYVKGSILESLGGYPFHTMTEDYELTLFLTLHNYTCTYNEKAVYYDEQPTSNHVSFTQRVRWVKGFMQARRLYMFRIYKEILGFKNYNRRSQIQYALGVMPEIILISIIGVYFFGNMMLSIDFLVNHNPAYWATILRSSLVIVGAYFVMLIFSAYLVFSERKKMPFTRKTAIKTIFFNPIFLAGFIPAAIKAALVKELEWLVIEHTTEQPAIESNVKQK